MGAHVHSHPGNNSTFRGPVLEMSVVRVWVECVTCVCVWLGAVWVERGVEWMEELGLGFTNPVGTGGSVGHVFVFWLRWCRWVAGLDQGWERWGGVMSV